MSVKDQMQQVQALIKEKRYGEARALLVQINHPTAQQWIAKIDEITGVDLDFPEEETPRKGRKAAKQKNGGPGCFKISLGVGCIAPAAFCSGLIVIAVIIAFLVQAGKESATEDAIKRNNDFGSFEKPIVAMEWAQFEKGNVRATRIIRPADEMIESFNMFNDESPTGADYVLVWFELECQSDKCNPRLLDLRLMDAQEKAWGEPWVLVLENDLDSEEALRDASISGWQGFEFPTGEKIQTIKIEWGSETLHVVPPDAEAE